MKHPLNIKRLKTVMRFAKRYTKGERSANLAAQAGVCLAVFLKYLRRGGVKIKKCGWNGGGNRPPNPNEAAILSMFDDGMTLQAIGDRFGLTRERVRQIATARGRKPRGHPKIKLPMKEVAEKYRTMTCDEIAPIYGVSNATINARLREHGVVMRKAGWRAK